MKSTVPVGVTGAGGVGTCDGWIATVAVKVTESPWFDGLGGAAVKVVCESNRSTGVTVAVTAPPATSSVGTGELGSLNDTWP
jgi:hypothetical protein